jgi:hypothetical protein
MHFSLIISARTRSDSKAAMLAARNVRVSHRLIYDILVYLRLCAA